jgi:hypothetical protein
MMKVKTVAFQRDRERENMCFTYPTGHDLFLGDYSMLDVTKNVL